MLDKWKTAMRGENVVDALWKHEFAWCLLLAVKIV